MPPAWLQRKVFHPWDGDRLPPGHIFGNRRLPDVDAELEQFAVNPWGAPERVGDADVMDQLPNVCRHLRTTTKRLRPPSPVQAKACAVPTDNGFWSNNCQGAQHTRSQAIQPGKHEAVDIAKSRLFRRPAPQDVELVAKRQDLDFKRSSRSEQSDQPAPDQPAELVHRAEASPDSLLFASRIKFATGTGHDFCELECSRSNGHANTLCSGWLPKISHIIPTIDPA